MLIRKFERQTIAALDDAGDVQRRPVVVMLMPHQPTEAQFFGQLLGALHAPVAGLFIRGFPLQDPAARLLHELGTRVVVIDELNSLLAGTPRQQRVFLQLLRFLSNETFAIIRVIFVGIQGILFACVSKAPTSGQSLSSAIRRGLGRGGPAGGGHSPAISCFQQPGYC